MHKLEEIHISNFRSCINTKLQLNDFTPIVGYNNAGKSNILTAIKWLLKPFGLDKSDFYNSDKSVVIAGKISGIDDDLLSELDSRHRTRIELFCKSGVIQIRRILDEPSSAVKVRLEIRDPAVDDELSDEAWVINPTGINQAISALFPEIIEINAMEDAAEDVAKFKTTTTIGKLIAEVMKPVQELHGQSISDVLSELSDKLDASGRDRPPEVEEFDEKANDVLADFFPGINIKLHVPTPDISQLFKTGTIRVYEGDCDEGRDISSLGHGAQRSIQMALVRYLAERKFGIDERVSRCLLLVEEPELFLHPQAIERVRVALKQLSKSGYQVIFSTHSPLPITSEDIPRTLLIRKTAERGTYARETLESAVRAAIADAPSQARVIFSLSNSSQLLFSDKVVLVEGKTERVLIPSIFEVVRDKTLGLAHISLIEQGGVCNTRKTLEILSAMNIPAKAIVDLDFAFRNAERDGFLSSDDEDIKSCKVILAEIVNKAGGILDGRGLPERGGSITSAEAFALLGDKTEAKEFIDNIHKKLRDHNIWIWKQGDIDNHLGLDGKDEANMADFLETLKQDGFNETVRDKDGVREFLEWVEQF